MASHLSAIKLSLDFMPKSEYLLPMNNSIYRVTPVFSLLYIGVFLIAPLFHLHSDEDHHSVEGERYHSHGLPHDDHSSNSEETAPTNGEDFQLLQIIPQLYRIHAVALEGQFLSVVLHLSLNIEYLPPPGGLSPPSTMQVPPITKSPQWDNYILYATSISPPLA